MTCQICKRKTDWDTSYGREEFIVCNSCMRTLAKHNIENYTDVMGFIFGCAEIRRKVREEQKNGI